LVFAAQDTTTYSTYEKCYSDVLSKAWSEQNFKDNNPDFVKMHEAFFADSVVTGY
jgi:hypothetical protein